VRAVAVLLTLSLLACPAVAGTLVLDHDYLTRRLRREIPSGSIMYRDGRVVIVGHVKRVGGLVNIPFRIVAYFTRASGRTRLTAEELHANGSKRDDYLAKADEKLALLIDEPPADKVEIKRGGKLAFEQVLP
jgi:hypothetical protein